MASVRLVRKRWLGREWQIDCDGASHSIRYSGRELFRETVYVDGLIASRRTGRGRMSCGYRFLIYDANEVALSVAIPWWCELLPLCDLSFVRLELNGECLYEEGKAPNHTMKWTGAAARGFEVRSVPEREW